MSKQEIIIQPGEIAHHYEVLQVPEVPIVSNSDIIQGFSNLVKNLLFVSSEEEQVAIYLAWKRAVRSFLRQAYLLEQGPLDAKTNAEGLPEDANEEEKLKRASKRIPLYKAFQDALSGDGDDESARQGSRE